MTDTRENSWRRAQRDTKSVILGSLWFWVAGVLFTVAGAVFASPWCAIAVPGFAIAVFVYFLVRAPYVQRDEARAEEALARAAIEGIPKRLNEFIATGNTLHEELLTRWNDQTAVKLV